jgi:hypothetical protein
MPAILFFVCVGRLVRTHTDQPRTTDAFPNQTTYDDPGAQDRGHQQLEVERIGTWDTSVGFGRVSRILHGPM